MCAIALTGVLAAVPATAQTTELFIHSQQGDYIGQGRRFTLTAGAGTWTGTSDGNLATIRFDGPTFWWLDFRAPIGASLAVGTYDNAYDLFNAWAQPVLRVSGEGRSCSRETGRFQILEIQLGANGTLARFAADFEQHCDGAGPGLFGAVRFNSTIATAPPFGGAYPDYRLTLTPSAHGSVVGDQVLCGSGQSSCARTWSFPANITLLALPDPGYDFAGWSGACFGGSAITILVNGPKTCEALFEVESAPPARTIVAFDSLPGDFVGRGQPGFFTDPDAVRVFVQGTDILVEARSHGRRLMVHFGPPSGGTLAPGSYEAGRAPTSALARFDAALDSAGCSDLNARFLVRDLQRRLDGSIERFSADWEAHCGGAPAGFFGVVRYESSQGGLRAFDGAYPDYRITITPSAGGTVRGEGLQCRIGGGPCEVTIPTARDAILTADPDAGYVLVGWTGGCVGAQSATVVVNRPRGCQALFDQLANRTVGTLVSMIGMPGSLADDRSIIFPASGVTVAYYSFSTSKEIDVTATAENAELRVTLRWPPGITPAEGTFDDVTGTTSWAHGSLNVSFVSGFSSSFCSQPTGRFVVRDLAIAGSTVTTLSADIELHCGGKTAGLFGAIRYNSFDDVRPFDGAFPTYRLTIDPNPLGTVTGPSLSCGPGATACDRTFGAATSVTLESIPAPGFMFAGWTGACRGSGAYRAVVVVNAPRRCGALFTPLTNSAPRTLLALRSSAASFANGASTEIHSAADSRVTSSVFSGLEVSFEDPSVDVRWTVMFSLPTGQPLSVGVFTVGVNSPSLYLLGRSNTCFASSGQFRIRDIATASNSVTRLSAEFAVRCGSSSNAEVWQGLVLVNAVGSVEEMLRPGAPTGFRITGQH